MEIQPDNQAKVLACIDGSTLMESVCDYASWIALKVNAPLKLLHTINHHQESSIKSNLSGNIGLGAQSSLLEEITQLEQQQSQLKKQKGKLLLQSAKQRVIDNGLTHPICSQRHGDLTEAVVDLENSIRVLVLGLRGQVHDQQKNQIGAKLEVIIRALHKPILIVNGAFKQPEHIMLAYDGSEAADKAVDMVATSPLYQGLNCHLVCVNNNQQIATKLLDNAAQKLTAVDNIQLSIAQLKGQPKQALCTYQTEHEIDLTIMGAFSHTRLHDMLLGSFTHKMLLNSHKALLLLR